jgi:WD40 repeat protein
MKKTQIGTLVGPKDAVISVAFSPDGTRIASGSQDNTIRGRCNSSNVRCNSHDLRKGKRGSGDGYLLCGGRCVRA